MRTVIIGVSVFWLYRFFLFFFFSSRRRHTRFDCDWSLDVCSSDLPLEKRDFLRGRRAAKRRILKEFEEPGLQEFLQDSSLSGTATPKEVAFLKRLKFQGQRPTPLYYYRELQSLRDPLHFRPS